MADATVGINLRATASGKEAVESVGKSFAGVEKQVEKTSKTITKEMRQAEGIIKQAGSGAGAHWTSQIANVASTLGTLGNTALTVFKMIAQVGMAAFNAILGAARFAFGIVEKLISGVLGIAKTLASHLIGVASTLAKLGAAGVLAGGALGVAGGVGATSTYAGFEQAIRNAMTTTGLTGEALYRAEVQMSQLARDIGAFSTFAAKDVADSFYSLASAGFDVNQIMAASPGVVALAEGTLENMGSTAELVSSQLMAFRMEASETNRVVNVLAAAAAASPLNMSRLAESLKYLSPVAKNFNLELEDATALLGVLSKVGLHGSEAGTALRQIMLRTVTQRGPGKEVLKQAGLTSETFSPQYVGAEGMIAGLQRVAATTGMGGMSRLVGLEGVSAAMALATAGTEEFRKMREQVTGTNMAFQMQALQLETIQGRWLQFTSMLEEAQHSFGEGARSGIMAFLGSLTETVQVLKDAGVFQTAGQVFGYVARVIGEAARQLQPYAPLIQQVLAQAGTALAQFIQAGMQRLPYVLSRVFTLLQNAPQMLAFVMDRAMVVGDWLLNQLPTLLFQGFMKAGEFLNWLGNAMNQAGAYLREGFQSDVAQAVNIVFSLGHAFISVAATIQGVLVGLGTALWFGLAKPVMNVLNSISLLQAMWAKMRGNEAAAREHIDAARSGMALMAITESALAKTADTSWVGKAHEALREAQPQVVGALRSAGNRVGGLLQSAAPWAYSGSQFMYGMAQGFNPANQVQYQANQVQYQVPTSGASGFQRPAIEEPGFADAPWQPWMSPREGPPQPVYYGNGPAAPKVFTSRGWAAPAAAGASAYGGGSTLVFNINGSDKQTIMGHVGSALDSWMSQNRRNAYR